jgi:hypothetical protein
MSPTFIWGLGAGVPAVVLEYLYRTLPGSWSSYLWVYAPMQLLIGYSIYRLVTTPGTSLLDALVVFAGATAGLRILATFMLGDQIRTGTWIAFGLVMTANIVRTYWESITNALAR